MTELVFLTLYIYALDYIYNTVEQRHYFETKIPILYPPPQPFAQTSHKVAISEFVKLDIIRLGSFGCVFDDSFHNQLLFYTIAPIFFTIVLVIYYAVATAGRNKAKRGEVSERRKR